ncbi:MAG: cytochrome c3 family protein [Deltaproteobacteria bacterium]|nr:cytochrome c3 family protein [Deltaproteobacteria bacterium]
MTLINRSWATAVTLITALFVAGSAVAAPGDGLALSAHDFTDDASVAVGLCTFCHTPHRAQQTKLLWNHTLSSLSYSWADTTVTTNGTTLPTFDNTWQGVSKNCLSCHDGTVAIGDIAWFDATPNQNLFADQHNDPADPRLITFAVPGTGDMSGNHPVAHPFPYQGAASTYNSVSSGTEVVASGWVADPTAGGIRLFNDDGSGNVSAGPIAGQTGIECSSCHDPHNGTQVLGEYFLRGTLTGSDSNYICLKCHDK